MVEYTNIIVPGDKNKITINNDENKFNTDVYNTGFFRNIVNYLNIKMLIYENKLNEYRLLYKLYEQYENENSEQLIESIDKLNSINVNDRQTYYQNDATHNIEKYYWLFFYIYYFALIIVFLLYFILKPKISLYIFILISAFLVLFPLYAQYAISLVIEIVKKIYFILPKNSYLS